MKRFSSLTATAFALALTAGCKPKPAVEAPAAVATAEVTDLSVLAAAVPATGPRTGNSYKLFFKVLRQDQSPAVGFKVDAWVKGLSEPKTLLSDKNGIVKFEDLPFPDSKHQVNLSLHYFKGSKDDAREISYPYLDTDAYRMKDTQYIPNTVTPEAQ